MLLTCFYYQISKEKQHKVEANKKNWYIYPKTGIGCQSCNINPKNMRIKQSQLEVNDVITIQKQRGLPYSAHVIFTCNE